mmetsp:Transcript_12583/g.28533  ORF Transcript_12583/g.28533 Transcript_12583/m.28533 type:complete len:260 (+) Transcript_12583:127-906(+)
MAQPSSTQDVTITVSTCPLTRTSCLRTSSSVSCMNSPAVTPRTSLRYGKESKSVSMSFSNAAGLGHVCPLGIPRPPANRFVALPSANCSTADAALRPSPSLIESKKWSSSSRSRMLSDAVMPASRKTTPSSVGAASVPLERTRIFPGCRSACTKLCPMTIFSSESTPSLPRLSRNTSCGVSGSRVARASPCSSLPPRACAAFEPETHLLIPTPSSNVSTRTAGATRGTTGCGKRTRGSPRKLMRKRSRQAASCVRSSWS